LETIAMATERKAPGGAGSRRGEARPDDARRDDARWTEHLCRAADAFAAEMRGAVPPEFTKHAQGSMREALLAVRSLVDTAIDRMDREAKPKARKVDVE
jgi:hypothetical protein